MATHCRDREDREGLGTQLLLHPKGDHGQTTMEVLGCRPVYQWVKTGGQLYNKSYCY